MVEPLGSLVRQVRWLRRSSDDPQCHCGVRGGSSLGVAVGPRVEGPGEGAGAGRWSGRGVGFASAGGSVSRSQSKQQERERPGVGGERSQKAGSGGLGLSPASTTCKLGGPEQVSPGTPAGPSRGAVPSAPTSPPSPTPRSTQLVTHQLGLLPSQFMPVWFSWLQNFFGYYASLRPACPQIHSTPPPHLAR